MWALQRYNFKQQPSGSVLPLLSWSDWRTLLLKKWQNNWPWTHHGVGFFVCNYFATFTITNDGILINTHWQGEHGTNSKLIKLILDFIRVSLPVLLCLIILFIFDRLDLSNCSLAHIKDLQEASTAFIMYETSSFIVQDNVQTNEKHFCYQYMSCAWNCFSLQGSFL